MAFTIRPAGPGDEPAFVAIQRDLYAYAVVHEEAFRHHWATEPARAHALRLVAEEDGRVAGVGRAGLSISSSLPGASQHGLLVRPDYRGRGLGGELFDRLMAHLGEVGGTRVEGWGDGDEATVRFLGTRGFAQRHELRYSHLNLGGPLPPTPAAGAHVRAVSFAETTPEEVFAVDSEAVLDEPGDTPADAMDFAEWRSTIWDAPDTDKAASVLVYADGQPAAYTLVETDLDRRMWSGGTGTRRAFRGRGLAKYAKSVALRRAAERGITDAFTPNDEENGPMLAINEWLGYRPCGAQFSYLRALSS
ncbi:MAG: GNAT family N-acetyltransferase [Hamadaea sp.]|nr:GNAT family N-acetyltransferase [Hamadaea sp.]